MKSPKTDKTELNLRTFFELFLLLIALAFFLKSVTLDFFVVSSGSMEPTLQKKDFILVSRLAYFFGISSKIPFTNIRISDNLKIWYKDPEMKDVIMIDNYIPSLMNYSEKYLVKRITAVPGDLIFYSSDSFGHLSLYREAPDLFEDEFNSAIIPAKGTSVRIDNRNIMFYKHILLNENPELADNLRDNDYISSIDTLYTFKQNHYFVEGDNSGNSLDSRAFGLIPEKSVQGKAIIIYWSLAESKVTIFDRFLKFIK